MFNYFMNMLGDGIYGKLQKHMKDQKRKFDEHYQINF